MTPLGAVALAHGYPVAQGYDGPPPLTVARALGEWALSVPVLVALVAAAGLYLWGVIRLRRRGDAWSPWRTLSFLVPGLGTAAVATLSFLAAYDDTLFSVHMVQHMVLSMVSPIFLALGAPVTLALRTLPRGGRRALVAVLHSRAARVLSFPPLTAALFVATLFGLYFTGVYQASLEQDWLHELLHLHFLLVGCLFFWPLLGTDPVPGRLPYPMRLLLLFVTLPAHAWLGIAIMSSRSVLAGGYYAGLHRPWGPSLLADQQLGGGILWGTGDMITLVILLILFVQWVHNDERAAARGDRQADRLAREHREDTELAAYNAMLVDLARRTEAADRARARQQV